MNITKLLYVFLIILFLIILIIVIFKSIIPLIGAGVEIKGYIGNLKGNFDIEISKNNSILKTKKYQVVEDEEQNNKYISSQDNMLSEYEEQKNEYITSNVFRELPISDEQIMDEQSYMPSEHGVMRNLQISTKEYNDEYIAPQQNMDYSYYVPSEDDVFHSLQQPSISPEEVNISNIEEEENNNLIFNSYIPLNKLSDSNIDMQNLPIFAEDIIESFDSVDGYDNPIFVMFYAPWCSFSKKVLPDFQKLKQNYQGKIDIVLVNSDDEKDVVIKHKVQQYPTIRYYPNGMNVPQYVDYNQERNYDSYIQYLNSVTDRII
jgi:thiol-disulfide isomerase/thioredoxin